MCHSPATPNKPGKPATEPSSMVSMPFANKPTSTSKVKQACLNEPSPASTYGDTVGSSCPATPQEVAGHNSVADLTESLLAAQIDPAIKSISGSPLPALEAKPCASLCEAHLGRCKTASGDEPNRALSTSSSPSSYRLNAIRNSADWRGDGTGNDVSFVRQSTNQPDDPFIADSGTSQAAGQTGAAFSPRPDRAGVPVTNDNAQALLPPSACIFVANLTSTQSDDQLEHHVHKAFCQFGNCYVKIRRDPSSMPFAFVQYETETDALRAVREGRGMAITGRECRTEIARVNRTRDLSPYEIMSRGPDGLAGSLYLSRIVGGVISEDEARQLLSRYGQVQETWYASKTDREMYRLPVGIWVRFAFFGDCRDAQAGFKDHPVYRLEQPRLPEDIHARLRGRQYRAPLTTEGFSPVQRRSAGRVLPSPMRTARTDLASIFVGDLPEFASQEHLIEMFQTHGQILHVDMVRKASVNNSSAVNTFAFIEFLSPEMAVAAVQASPRTYNNLSSHPIRVERKQSVDPFARRDAPWTTGESSLNRYPQDMAMLYQRGVFAGMAQAAQALPAPPVYGGYSYYQPYDPAQFNQFAGTVNPFGTPAAAETTLTAAMSTQGTSQYQYGHQGQVPTPGMNHYQYAQTSPSYAQQLQQPPRQVYQWPPANTGNDDASPSH